MPRTCPPTRRLLGVLAAALLTCPAVAAPADEALRVVPPGTTICLVVRDLRTHAATAAASPFAAWLESSGYVRQFLDPADLDKLRTTAAGVTAQLGVSPEQVRDDVVGDAVVLAYQPGRPGATDEESGLVLVRPRKPDVLAGIVTRVNELQTSSGELKGVTDKTHRDRMYTERAKADGGREFVAALDGVFAFTTREAVVRAVIDRYLDAKDAGPVAAGLTRLGLSDTFAACWFDPRGFDAQLAAQFDATKDANERAFLDQFRKLWAAADGLALYAQPGRGIEAGFVAAFDEPRVPAELRPILKRPTGGAGLWSVVPADALFATGGRLNAGHSLAAVGSFLPADGKAGLKVAIEQGVGPLVGRDKLPAVQAGIGPTWAAWVTPPATGEWVPGWTVALQLDPGEATRPVLQAIDFVVQMGRFAYNRDHKDQIELGEESQDGVAVKYLSNPAGFPPGVRPAYAVKQGYLVLASSPDVVRRFHAPTTTTVADAPVLRLSARHLRDYLAAHRTPLAAALAKSGGKSADVVGKELEQIGRVLAAVEQIDVRYDAGDGRIKLSAQVELAKPLNK